LQHSYAHLQNNKECRVSNFTKPFLLGAITLSLTVPLTFISTEALSAQRGLASWYGPGFAGRRTASGERFNPQAMTAAHRTLPFGSHVTVTNERTGRSVIVRINDRGPFRRSHIIDLSKGSAAALGVGGSAPVSLVPLARSGVN
jgi:rare lipoprotein A